MADSPKSVSKTGEYPTIVHTRRTFSWDRVFPFLTLVPSIIGLGIFVYGFIAWSGYISLVNWNSFIPNFSFAGLKNYVLVLESFRFQSDLRNIVIFTVLFILGNLAIGMVLALLVDQKIRAESFFRSIFIFPMAVSFVVTGVIWSWILNPETGVTPLSDHGNQIGNGKSSHDQQ